MKSSWLVQRLNKPWKSGLGGDNPFAFGGGLRNGGLSEEAMDMLRDIFSFDYMGAAEFEFGAVPEALRVVAAGVSADEYTTFSFRFPLKKVHRSWSDKSAEPVDDAEIYVICRAVDMGGVTIRIKNWAFAPYERENQLKESTMLSQVLRPSRHKDGRVDYIPSAVGWLELDNGFFFFVDREMWQKTSDLFGIETGDENVNI